MGREGLYGTGQEGASPIWRGVRAVEEVGVVVPDRRGLRELLDKDLEEFICFLFSWLELDSMKRIRNLHRVSRTEYRC